MVGDKTWLDVGFVLCMDNGLCTMKFVLLRIWLISSLLCVFICLLRSNSGHWSTPIDVQCPRLLIVCVRSEKGRNLLPCYLVLNFGLMYITVVHAHIIQPVYQCTGTFVITLAHLFLFDILMCNSWFYYATIRCRLIP